MSDPEFTLLGLVAHQPWFNHIVSAHLSCVCCGGEFTACWQISALPFFFMTNWLLSLSLHSLMGCEQDYPWATEELSLRDILNQYRNRTGIFNGFSIPTISIRVDPSCPLLAFLLFLHFVLPLLILVLKGYLQTKFHLNSCLRVFFWGKTMLRQHPYQRYM